MIFPGDILIPEGCYRYSLQVKKVTPGPRPLSGSPAARKAELSSTPETGRLQAQERAWWPEGYLHTVMTRFDLSPDGDPVFENRSDLHIHYLKQIEEGRFQDLYDQDFGRGAPMFFKRWKPARGQLSLF